MFHSLGTPSRWLPQALVPVKAQQPTGYLMGPNPLWDLVSSSDSTLPCWRLIEAPISLATFFQASSTGSMVYRAPSNTLSGICNLQTPYAVCTLNVQATGDPLPPINAPGSIIGASENVADSSSSSSKSSGAIWIMSSLAVGFCISISLISITVPSI